MASGILNSFEIFFYSKREDFFFTGDARLICVGSSFFKLS